VITLADGGGAKLPGVGHVSKKWLMIVGGASVLSIGYFLYKRKSAAAAAAPAAVDTTGTAGQLDPLTGDIAGSAQDQMDLASLQAGGYGSTSGGYYAGQGALGTSGVTPPVPGTGGFTTNGQWAQQAEADLGGIGIDQLALAAALGHYLTGVTLSTAEQSLVDQAIAEEGYPPVAGPSGYPPAMHASATGGGSTGGGSGGTGGGSGGGGDGGGGTGGGTGGGGTGGGTGGGKLGAITGLHLVSKTSNSVTLAWNPVAGATHYNIAYGYPSVSQFHTTSNSASVTIGFAAGHGSDYHFQVTAQNSTEQGPYSSVLVVTGI
jgi:hypothetical protein